MKILFVAPWIPASVRPRSLVILEMLAAEHDVRFLALTHDDKEVELADQLPVKERTLVPNPRAGSMLRSARALGTPGPDPTVEVHRTRTVQGSALTEQIRVTSRGGAPVTAQLVVQVVGALATISAPERSQRTLLRSLDVRVVERGPL